MPTSMTGATPQVSRLKGTGYEQVRIPPDPRTSQLYDFFSQGIEPGLRGGFDFLSSLAGGGNEEMWRKLEAPAMRQFGQLQGQVASRFSGAGLGARRSSGFQNVMGGAATDLAERLQAQRMALQSGAIESLMGMGRTLLGTPLGENALIPKKRPMWQEFLLAFAPGLAQGAGQAGGIGAMKGMGVF